MHFLWKASSTPLLTNICTHFMVKQYQWLVLKVDVMLTVAGPSLPSVWRACTCLEIIPFLPNKTTRNWHNPESNFYGRTCGQVLPVGLLKKTAPTFPQEFLKQRKESNLYCNKNIWKPHTRSICKSCETEKTKIINFITLPILPIA